MDENFQTTKRSIVLLEDNPIDANMVLRQLPDDVINHFKSLGETLAHLRTHTADLIITDLNVSDSRGLETFYKIRDKAPHIPIIILTNNLSLDDAKTAVQSGAQDYIFKEELLKHNKVDATISLSLERAKLQDALVKAEQVARQQSEFKSTFLAQFSHEIRTPLNAVIGMASLLDPYVSSTEGINLLNSLKIGADRLFSIVDDILDISKIESGTLELYPEMVNIREVVENMVRLFGAEAKAKGVYVACVIDSAVPMDIETDPKRLKQVFANLIGNALKFTQQGSIVIRAEYLAADHRIRFLVSDTGCGISKADIEKLFVPFVQVGKRHERKKGTGLGMTISKRLIEALGGSIRVSSVLGTGTTFTFDISTPQVRDCKVVRTDMSGKQALLINIDSHLEPIVTEFLQVRDVRVTPLREAPVIWDNADLAIFDHQTPLQEVFEVQRHLPVVVISDSLSAVNGQVRLPLVQSEFYQAVAEVLGEQGARKTPRSQTTSGQDFGCLKVMIVDDDPMNIKVLESILVKYGVRPVAATNGEEAVATYEQDPNFDVIFMDCSMPVMDGFEAAEILRRNNASAEIVAVTAHAFERDRKRCRDVGMETFLTKPIRIPDLERALESVKYRIKGGT